MGQTVSSAAPASWAIFSALSSPRRPIKERFPPNHSHYVAVMGLLYRAVDAIRRRYLQHNHGRLGEDLAHRYLRRRGCTVIARNYRTRSGSGEIDIVAWHGQTLAFVEVKTRQTDEYGVPDRAVDAEKQQRLQLAARDYIRRSGVLVEQTRFDVVSVVLEGTPRVEWLRDAFARS
jgi:putative endonuclease